MASRRDWLKAAALLPPLLFLRDALAQGRLEKGVYRRRGEVKISGDSVSSWSSKAWSGASRLSSARATSRTRRPDARTPGGFRGGWPAIGWHTRLLRQAP